MSEKIQPHRLRELRDKALRYIRENGAGMPKGEVPIVDLKNHLDTTDAEFRSLSILLHTNHLAQPDGMNVHIGLTDAGRREADNIDHPVASASINITYNLTNSVLQNAGSNSVQSATLTLDQSHLTQVLDQIEESFPS
jgi:hypothetical protein